MRDTNWGMFKNIHSSDILMYEDAKFIYKKDGVIYGVVNIPNMGDKSVELVPNKIYIDHLDSLVYMEADMFTRCLYEKKFDCACSKYNSCCDIECMCSNFEEFDEK